MANLSISLLGRFQVMSGSEPIKGFKSNKGRALLAYLAVEADRPHRRESLAGLLWPDYSDHDALSNLRFTLYDLRRTIGDRSAERPFLLVTRDSIQFNQASDYWLDVAAFESMAVVDKKQPVDVDRLQQAAGWYLGSFMEGFSLSDSPPFEEWQLFTRERLARLMSSVLHRLAATYEQRGEFELAENWSRRLIELEPWDETAHQQLMRVLALSGRRSAALAQYETCRRLLSEELDVEPSVETVTLYRQIRDGELKAPARIATEELTAHLPAFLGVEPPKGEIPLFVAREREIAQLRCFLEKMLTSQGQVVFVTGEIGSGKTALVQEFIRRTLDDRIDQSMGTSRLCSGRDLAVASGSCNAYTGIGDPYLPFREILGLLTGDVESRWMAGAMTKEQACNLWNTLPWAAQTLVDFGPDLIDTFISRIAFLDRARTCAAGRPNWLTHLEEFITRKPTGPGVPVLQQSNLFEQYTRVLQTLARQIPLILVLDDLQWADMGTISLLFHLGRNVKGSRILIIGAYRPEEVAIGRGGERHPLESVINEFQRNFGDITVALGQSENRDFIDAVLDSEPNRLGNDFREMLFRQTRGHPLFTIELLRGLEDRRDLLQDLQGNWVEGPTLNWEALPARVEAAVAERIARLAEPLQDALRVASVEGEVFTAEVVARVCAADEKEMLGCLSSELEKKHRLIRAQSVRRLDGQILSGYSFRHILFQKYLYSSLDEVERLHLHEQVGACLEELYSAQERVEEIAAKLALHFQKARINDKAILYLREAGDRAVQLCAYGEGRAHLTGGLALLMSMPDTPERAKQELALQISMSKAWKQEMPSSEREAALSRARELCHKMGLKSQMCWVLGEMSILYYIRADYRKALKLSEEVLGLAEQAGDPQIVPFVHWCLGFILFGLGEYKAAHDHLIQVTSYDEIVQNYHPFVLFGADVGASAMAYDACCLWCLGYPERALKHSREALNLARSLHYAFSLADVLCYGGCLFNSMLGDSQVLQEDAEELIELSKEKGFLSFFATGTCYLGEALVWLGQVREGIVHLHEGLATRQSMADWCYVSGVLGALARAQADAGYTEEAMATLAEALALVEMTGERHWEAELNRFAATILLAQGDQAGAEASLHKAIEVARRQDAKSWELRAVIDLCRLWISRGKQAEAYHFLDEIYEWFTEGFNTADLITARRMLQELS